jgi:RNA polymerase sigma factor (sigma-70 family)
MPHPSEARPRHDSSSPLRGDEDALYRAHAARLRDVVRRHVRATDAQIEDACALAWLILLRRQPERDSVFAWLATVAIREAWRLTAADRDQAPLQRLDDPPGDAPYERVAVAPDLDAALDAAERLRAVVAALPERQRRLVALQAYGYSYAEMAGQTGDTPRSVERQLMRAKRRLDSLRTPLAA